jgi:hypothetical protein
MTRRSKDPVPPGPPFAPQVLLDGLGLLRCRRMVLRGLHSEAEVVRHIVGLMDLLLVDLHIGIVGADLRGRVTMLRTAMEQLQQTGGHLLGHLGALRALAEIDGYYVEEPEPEQETPKAPRRR